MVGFHARNSQRVGWVKDVRLKDFLTSFRSSFLPKETADVSQGFKSEASCRSCDHSQEEILKLVKFLSTKLNKVYERKITPSSDSNLISSFGNKKARKQKKDENVGKSVIYAVLSRFRCVYEFRIYTEADLSTAQRRMLVLAIGYRI